MRESNDSERELETSKSSFENENPPELREKGKTGWSEVMIENMVMSETNFGLTLDIPKTSIKMSSKELEETLEFIVESPEKVKILVDGSIQQHITSVELLKEIGKKIEEKDITSKKIIKKMLKGKDKNFFTKFTTLVTLLKLTFLLRQKMQEQKSGKTNSKNSQKENRDSTIGPYF